MIIIDNNSKCASCMHNKRTISQYPCRSCCYCFAYHNYYLKSKTSEEILLEENDFDKCIKCIYASRSPEQYPCKKCKYGKQDKKKSFYHNVDESIDERELFNLA